MPVHRADENQKEIVEGLRAIGISVLILSQVGGGCPDLLVVDREGNNILLEVKTEKGKLRESQKKFMKEWEGPIYLVRNLDDAMSYVILKQKQKE